MNAIATSAESLEDGNAAAAHVSESVLDIFLIELVEKLQSNPPIGSRLDDMGFRVGYTLSERFQLLL